jgi:hypothetical protein
MTTCLGIRLSVKRGLAALTAALLLALTLTACGGGETTASVSMYDLQQTMLAADDTLPEMTTVNSSSEDAAELFSYLSDLDYDKVESFFLSYCAFGTQADEIAVIQVKKAADQDAALQSLQDHAENRAKLYASYVPDQVQRVENALIFNDGNYIALIISEKQDQVKTALQDLLHP